MKTTICGRNFDGFLAGFLRFFGSAAGTFGKFGEADFSENPLSLALTLNEPGEEAGEGTGEEEKNVWLGID